VSRKIAVVVLTWNNHEYTLDCLRSLAEQTLPHTVYVVDNASTDGTPEIVAARFPNARVIVNDTNLGFAGGNNVGMQAAFADGADAVLVLNNDTTLVPDVLALLTDTRGIHPDAGIISPAILYAQQPHKIWFAGANLNTWMGWSYHAHHNAPYESLRRQVRRIARTTGCAMLITHECYTAIGGYDDDFFMYYEDVEYSLHARRAGFETYLVPDAVVYHHVSASFGEVKPGNAVYYGVRNGMVTMDRHYPLPFPLSLARHVTIVVGMIYYVVKPPSAPARVRDIFSGYRDAQRRWLGPRHARYRTAKFHPVRDPQPSPAPH